MYTHPDLNANEAEKPRRRILSVLVAVAALACAALGLIAGTAQAAYYFSESDARWDVKDYARDHYGMTSPASRCRPQGRSAPESGYIYHRWVCAWADTDADGYVCYGKVLIAGSRDQDMYWSKVLRGMRCE